MCKPVVEAFNHLLKPSVLPVLSRNQPGPPRKPRRKFFGTCPFRRYLRMHLGGGIHIRCDTHFGHTTQIRGIHLQRLGNPDKQGTSDPSAIMLNQIQVTRRNVASIGQLSLPQAPVNPV